MFHVEQSGKMDEKDGVLAARAALGGEESDLFTLLALILLFFAGFCSGVGGGAWRALRLFGRA